MKKNQMDEESLCIYCAHSTPIMDTDACVCDLYGVVMAEGYCKKFKIDLLKIKPRPPRVLQNNNPEFFKF